MRTHMLVGRLVDRLVGWLVGWLVSLRSPEQQARSDERVTVSIAPVHWLDADTATWATAHISHVTRCPHLRGAEGCGERDVEVGVHGLLQVPKHKRVIVQLQHGVTGDLGTGGQLKGGSVPAGARGGVGLGVL